MLELLFLSPIIMAGLYLFDFGMRLSESQRRIRKQREEQQRYDDIRLNYELNKAAKIHEELKGRR